MRLHRWQILFALLLLVSAAYGQAEKITGLVQGLEPHCEVCNDTIPLIGANIYWMDTGIGTVTNTGGRFTLRRDPGHYNLVISYVGYEKDTLFVAGDQTELTIYLKQPRNLEKVVATAELPTAIDVKEEVVNSRVITAAGLKTAACCNLAESFVSTAAIDVEETDAVSGARRIKMLGLAGYYTQILIEKKPVMRGLISPFGLDYVPGFWMQSVNISKGTASVATGYESITGQINIELKKPEIHNGFAANLFQNTMGRSELSLIGGTELSPRLKTLLLAYGTLNRYKMDGNGDAFIDKPLVSIVNVMNRWKYRDDKIAGQLGFKVIYDHRDGGQEAFDFGADRPVQVLYGSHNRIDRYEFYGKLGMLPTAGGSTVGLIFSAFRHKQASFWGSKEYTGDESSLYANLIYEKEAGRQKIALGLSYVYDKKYETYQSEPFKMTESVPGVYVEYTYKIQDKFTGMAGFRFDRHNHYGNFYTPRMHLQYNLDLLTSFRFSLGRGYRTPHIFMENPAILASARQLVFLEDLQHEEAWNGGLQFIKDFELASDRSGSLILDYYRTEFQNQITIDLDRHAQQIVLYNLNGKSYSNSAQVELNAELFKGLNTTTAFRYNDVKATYNDVLQEVPLNSRYKGLLVLSYLFPGKKWQVDFTAQYNGKTRLPNTSSNPAEYQLDATSPAYGMFFLQVQRKFEGWEIYAGIENLTGYRQANPILAADQPFSPYFDSSMIWGPVVGRRFYMGIRVN